MHLHMHTGVRMGLWAHAFQSGVEMNRRCGSRTVLTGSLARNNRTHWPLWLSAHGDRNTLPPLLWVLSAPHCVAHSHPLLHSLMLLVLFFYVSPLLRTLFTPPFPLSSVVTPQLYLPLSVFAPFLERGGVGSLVMNRYGSQNICLPSLSICHQRVHCHTFIPSPCGAEQETLKCVSSTLLFLKAKFWRSQM